VAALLPLVSGRTAQARFSRAASDLENMGEAEQRVAIDTGYYVRLHALNDTVGGTIAFDRNNPNDPLFNDGLGQYLAPASFIQNPLQVFIVPETNTLVDNATGTAILNDINQFETSLDPATVQWAGPYLNFTKDENIYNGIAARDLTPDDPWGNNYLLFTRDGVVVEPDGVIVPTTAPLATGGFAQTGSIDAARFDRPTLLSLGPNGLPGDGTPTAVFGTDDDMVRAFGR